MNELLKEATRALKAIADYYEKQANPLRRTPEMLVPEEVAIDRMRAEVAAADARRAHLTAAEVPPQKKERKARAPKEEKAPETANPIDAALGGPKLVLTDDQVKASTEKIAETFVMRFKNATPTGVERAKAILKELGVERMGQLDRAGNVEFAKRIELELNGAAA